MSDYWRDVQRRMAESGAYDHGTIDSMRVDPPMPITLADIPDESPAVIAIWRDRDPGAEFWEYIALDGQEGAGWSSGDLGFHEEPYRDALEDLVAYINERSIVWRVLR